MDYSELVRDIDWTREVWSLNTATTALRVAETRTTNGLPLTTVQRAVATLTSTLRYVLLLEIVVEFVTDIINCMCEYTSPSYPRIQRTDVAVV